MKPVARIKAVEAMREALSIARSALEQAIEENGGVLNAPDVVTAARAYREAATALLPYEAPKLAAILQLNADAPVPELTYEQLISLVFPDGRSKAGAEPANGNRQPPRRLVNPLRLSARKASPSRH
jgi:hypothetical protein